MKYIVQSTKYRKARSLLVLCAVTVSLCGVAPARAAEMGSATYSLDNVNFASTNVITSTKDGIPPAITSQGPAVTNLTPNQATIAWVTDKPSTSQVRYDTQGKYGLLSGTADLVTNHSVTVTGLTEQTAYYYLVESVDAYGGTGRSDGRVFTTPARTQFKEVSISQVSYTSALVKVATGGLSSLTVRYGTSSDLAGAKQVNTSTLTTESNFPLTDLEPGTKYYLKIEGKDDKGNVYTVDNLVFTTVAPPVFDTVAATSGGPNDLEVAITTNTKTSVTVTYRSAKDGADQNTGDTALATSHTIKLQHLFGDTDYALTVTAVDEGGKRVTSDPVTARTATDTAAPVPTDPSVKVSKDSDSISVTARWQTDEPARTEVRLVSRTNAQDVRKVDVGGSYTLDHLAVAGNLAAKTSYQLVAVSTDSAGNQSTRTVDFVTPGAHSSVLDLISQSLGRIVDPIASLIKSL